ncbi:hypothetical protein [Longispora albida]|uniref:hypothetical protein n=1 Tax=Longispora albida TaxID=203523 RepID=UPI00037C9102|nr:hypothetical protein [Longispora albida]
MREPQLLGTLDTHVQDGWHRVVGLYMYDDVAGHVHTHWLRTGDIYGIVHDGASWTIAGGCWTEPGHTYRLHRPGRTVSVLPTAQGDRVLDRTAGYQVHAAGPEQWELWQVNTTVPRARDSRTGWLPRP